MANVLNHLEGLEYAIENCTRQTIGLTAHFNYFPDETIPILLSISDIEEDQLVEIEINFENNTMYIIDNRFIKTDDNMTDEKLIGNITRSNIIDVLLEYVEDMEILEYEEMNNLLIYILQDLTKCTH